MTNYDYNQPSLRASVSGFVNSFDSTSAIQEKLNKCVERLEKEEKTIVDISTIPYGNDSFRFLIKYY